MQGAPVGPLMSLMLTSCFLSVWLCVQEHLAVYMGPMGTENLRAHLLPQLLTLVTPLPFQPHYTSASQQHFRAPPGTSDLVTAALSALCMLAVHFITAARPDKIELGAVMAHGALGAAETNDGWDVVSALVGVCLTSGALAA
ncbi:hypothetical protein PAPYR_8192 [Paratrimastix pyriformis]|uniref:Dolichol kinase n=1 Tax=Paratrimastix pyriformis TaxID=342808 RepID=A0ABQ8UCN4_9EUKA|nr:hypothetical protein PAPYR_8192 [Paratrimastix pyriformis]